MELTSVNTIKSLQIGVGWLPEEKGNGLDRVFYALSRHLPETGVEVSGYVVGTGNVAVQSGETVRAFASKDTSLRHRLAALRVAIRNDLSRASYDLVASHFALFAYPALKYIGRLPLVVHFHGPWAAESRQEGERYLAVKAKWMLERKVYHRADRFIVLSEAFKDLLTREYGVDEQKIRIVRGGVQADRFDTGLSVEQARERLDWPADRPTVLVVRRLARRMGLENLIAAMVTVRQQVPEVLLLIAGSGPIRPELHDRIQAAGLQDHVKLLGFVPDEDLPLAYTAADVSVVPTVALEGFGLITIESMAAGTPVLVTDVGGLPETVRALSESMIMPDSSVKTLSGYLVDALTGVLQLPDEAACRGYARERFDWPVIAAHTRQVYEEVLS